MTAILHVITKQEFLDKYKAPFPGLDYNRIIAHQPFQDIVLDSLVESWGPQFTFGSKEPSRLIFQNGAMNAVQGELMYASDGKWYILDGILLEDQTRKPSAFGTGILIPDFVNRRYHIKALGIPRRDQQKNIIKLAETFHPLEVDGTLISLPHSIEKEAVGCHYLLRIDISDISSEI